MAEKTDLADYALSELMEQQARDAFLLVHAEEFRRFKAELKSSMIVVLNWKAARDKRTTEKE